MIECSSLLFAAEKFCLFVSLSSQMKTRMPLPVVADCALAVDPKFSALRTGCWVASAGCFELVSCLMLVPGLDLYPVRPKRALKLPGLLSRVQLHPLTPKASRASMASNSSCL
jgi:hypothetical protein